MRMCMCVLAEEDTVKGLSAELHRDVLSALGGGLQK